MDYEVGEASLPIPPRRCFNLSWSKRLLLPTAILSPLTALARYFMLSSDTVSEPVLTLAFIWFRRLHCHLKCIFDKEMFNSEAFRYVKVPLNWSSYSPIHPGHAIRHASADPCMLLKCECDVVYIGLGVQQAHLSLLS
jgi:hypothetical protein